ncbi:hypothetical protein IscW_ISCW012041, partial [Ixodes scapularis]
GVQRKQLKTTFPSPSQQTKRRNSVPGEGRSKSHKKTWSTEGKKKNGHRRQKNGGEKSGSLAGN